MLKLLYRISSLHNINYCLYNFIGSLPSQPPNQKFANINVLQCRYMTKFTTKFAILAGQLRTTLDLSYMIHIHIPWCESPPVVVANLHSVLSPLLLLELLHLLLPGFIDIEHEERTRVVLCNLQLIQQDIISLGCVCVSVSVYVSECVRV